MALLLDSAPELLLDRIKILAFLASAILQYSNHSYHAEFSVGAEQIVNVTIGLPSDTISEIGCTLMGQLAKCAVRSPLGSLEESLPHNQLGGTIITC